jgi:hypothetical protein
MRVSLISIHFRPSRQLKDFGSELLLKCGGAPGNRILPVNVLMVAYKVGKAVLDYQYRV